MLTLSGLDPSRPADNQAELDRFRQLGEAAVFLAKSAGSATVSYALKGKLYLSKSGWLMLDIPAALVRGAFDALNEPGVELPLKDGKLTPHVSVMSPDEVAKIGGPDAITERGHHFSYTLGAVKAVEPTTWSGIGKVWYITIQSPDLRNLRKSYGLEPLRNGYDHHITIGIRKRGVLHANEKRKGEDGVEGESKAASEGTQQLAGDDRPLHETKSSAVQGLRRSRDHDLRKVAGFLSLLGGHGIPSAGENAGAAEKLARILTDKLLLGYPQGTEPESPRQSSTDLPRRNQTPDRVGRGDRVKAASSLQPAVLLRLVSGEGSDDAAGRIAQGQSLAHVRQPDADTGSLGQGTKDRGGYSSSTPEEGLAGGEGADAAGSLKQANWMTEVPHLVAPTMVAGLFTPEDQQANAMASGLAHGAAAVGGGMLGQNLNNRAFNKLYKGRIVPDSVSKMLAGTLGSIAGLSGLHLTKRVVLGEHKQAGEEIRKAAAERVTTIAVDLDGTLAKPGPFKGPDHFYLPRRGAAKFMKSLKAKGHRVIINTCRGDKESIEEWLNEHGIPYDHVNDNPDQPDGTSDKIVADAYVDDRAIHADGDWSRILGDIESRLEERKKTTKKAAIPEPIHRLLNLPPIQDWLADKSLQGNLVYSDGSNLAIQAQRRAERRMAWDAAKQNAKLDQPKYRDFLGGLATLSGTKPNPKLVDRASNDMTTLSPYVATMFAQKRGGAEEVMPFLDDIVALVMAHRAKQNNPGPVMPKLTLGLPSDSVEMPKVAKVHHTAAVTVQRRDSEILVCPHCNKELETKDIYRDAKGWTFCRPCFRKGKGSIKIPEWIGKIEKSAIETPDVEHLARCSEPVDANEFILP